MSDRHFKNFNLNFILSFDKTHQNFIITMYNDNFTFLLIL